MRRPRVLMATMLASVAIFATVASSSTTGGVSDSHARPRARSEPFFDFIRDIAFDPHDSKTIWAVLDADSALYRTDDGAHSWRRVSVLPPRQLIGVIGLDHSGHHLWVGAKYDPLLWHSADGGATWRRVAGWPTRIVPIGTRRLRPAVVSALAVDPRNPHRVYAVAQNVVLRTDDSGRSWRRVSRGLPKGEPTYAWFGGDLVLDPLHPNVLYFVTHSRGVYRSRNAGGQWVRTSHRCSRDCIAKAYGHGYTMLAIDPTRPRRLYAGLAFDVYRALDGGDRWRRVLRIDRGFGGDLVVASDGTVYANGSRKGVVYVARSRDGGRSWTLTLGFNTRPPGTAYLGPGPIAVNPTNPAVALAAVGAGNDGGAPVCVRLLKTTNRGATWEPADDGLVAAARRCAVR
jgi:photosystem II stability/assembly factor-like uncharacterized protein